MKLALNSQHIDSNALRFSIDDDNTPITVTDTGLHNDMSAPAYLNLILAQAIQAGASDIHFEPYHDHFRIRLRIDGMMQEAANMPKGFGHLLSARLKVISGLDISEQRIAQSGRFKLFINNSNGLDFRCSVLPTLHGETIVLRLLYLPQEMLTLDKLGLATEQIPALLYAINQLQGMVLVTGPTGSGKTMTLYTLLKHISQQARNLYSVEDPVEIDLHGVNQVSIGERITFAEAARTVLRQDPDVIMLGEIRDKATLDTAIKAAHTGHLVLSTLHANTAPKAITRLKNLGISAYDIASTTRLIISQRLLRKLDPETREPATYPPEQLRAIGFSPAEIDKLANGSSLYRAVPGDSHTGYKDRTGIFQVMYIDNRLADAIAQGATDNDIQTLLDQQGLPDMRRSALDKVKAGITDIAEVERVLGLADNYLPNSQPTLATSQEDNR